jgi:methylmalonyl-CoA mutase cobalamin-binding domain/chain
MKMLRKAELLGKLKESLLSFDSEAVKKEIEEAIQTGLPVEEIIEALRCGMEVVGDRYRAGEFFVTDLIVAGEIMREAQDALEPFMKNAPVANIATIVVATVAGDIHDIGKNIFVMLMRAEGFKVIDLGVDVSSEKIIDAVKEYMPEILGLSALLTTNLEEFPKIVDILKREGLREKVKVIIGGATVTEQFAREIGVDAYAKTAVEGISLSRMWIEKSTQTSPHP